MTYEFKKVRDVTEAELSRLKAQGWEYVGPVQKKGKDTDVLRFRRPVGEAPESDTVLSPKDVKQRMNTSKP